MIDAAGRLDPSQATLVAGRMSFSSFKFLFYPWIIALLGMKIRIRVNILWSI